MTKFLFSDSSNQTASALGAERKKDNLTNKKNEFNFTNYINQLKESSKIYGENYVKNLSKKQQSEHSYKNKYNDYNANQDYNSLSYYDNRNQERPYSGNYNNSNIKQDKWGKQGGKNSNYNNNNNYYTNNSNNVGYNSNYNYAQQAAPPQKPKSNDPNDIFDYLVKQESLNNANTSSYKNNNFNNNNNQVEVVYTYEGDTGNASGRGKRGKKGRGGNDYKNFYENTQNEEINTVGLPPQKSKKAKKNKIGKFEAEQEQQNYSYNNDQIQFNDQNTNNNNNNSLYRTNFNNSNENSYQANNILNSNSNMLTMDPNVDYKFVLKNWVLGIREYLKEKITNEKLSENEFILPAETIYQMIVIIDRLEKQKILELQSIINFGFDLEIVKEVRILLLSGFYDKESIKHILDRLDIKKILLLYKYLHIASNKLNGLYYKLGI